MSIFKREKSVEIVTTQQHILKGTVEFVLRDQIVKGRIFGKPFRDEQVLLLSKKPLLYYVRKSGSTKVYKVPDYAIEEVI